MAVPKLQVIGICVVYRPCMGSGLFMELSLSPFAETSLNSHR